MVNKLRPVNAEYTTNRKTIFQTFKKYINSFNLGDTIERVKLFEYIEENYDGNFSATYIDNIRNMLTGCGYISKSVNNGSYILTRKIEKSLNVVILRDLYNSFLKDKLYIRFGNIPDKEISHVWDNTGKKLSSELGVSVYKAITINSRIHLVIPPSIIPNKFMTLHWLYESTMTEENPRHIYLVTGDFVGIGQDDEPLIRNVKILKDITEEIKQDYYGRKK